jgi:Trypsin-like peptidase domain
MRHRPSAPGFVLLLSGLALAGCAPAAPSSAPRVAASPRDALSQASSAEVSMSEVVDRALPAVVLLLSTRADGTIVYGAGLIVSKDGRVLTNQHVVEGSKTLGAMLYKPGRVSYTPMDGGLGRYIFENQKDLVPTTVLESDPVADLALVKIDADTSSAPQLVFSTRDVRPGDRVLALGHPQETVWSFTSGAVSALHNGAIQHDAVISSGSSGGPLLNDRGEVIGVNTARVVSESRGLSFARPISLAGRFLARGPGKSEVDLSSPEKAVVSCWHAHELGSPAITECVDWDSQWAVFQSALEEIRARRLSPRVAELVAKFGADEGKERWISKSKAAAADRLRTAGSTRSEAVKSALTAARELSKGAPGASAEVTKSPADRAIAELASVDADRRKKKLEENGIKVDLDNPATLHELLRMGVRIDATRAVGPDLVWVALAGRNPDGTPYRYSECWANVGGRWLQRTSPTQADIALLPAGWAPPIDDFYYARGRIIATLLGGAPHG